VKVKGLLFGFISVIWFFIASVIGSFHVLYGFLKGFSTSSFAQFVLSFLVLGIIIGIVSTLPLFGFIRNLSLKPPLKKVIIFILVLFPAIHILYNVGFLGIGLTPILTPPDAIDSKYKYQDTGIGGIGPSTEAIFSFNWDKNYSLENNVIKMKNTARFYEDYFNKKGGGSKSYSNYSGRVVSCEKAIDEDYQWYKEEVKPGAELTFGYLPSVRVDCNYRGRLFGFTLNLGENGGIIKFPSYGPSF